LLASTMKPASMPCSMRWRRIWRRIAMSSGCSPSPDEECQCAREQDQKRVGHAVERERAANVGGSGLAPPGAHEMILDRHTAIAARSGELEPQRPGEGRLRPAGVGRAM